MTDDLETKSALILGGNVKVPKGFTHPFADENSNGTGTFMLSFGNSRIYKSYSDKEGEFELVVKDGRYSLKKDGMPFLDEVEFVKRYCHAPNQANINLSKYHSDDEMLSYLQTIVDTGTVQGISVSLTPSISFEQALCAITKIHEAHPSIPIGFSYRSCSKEDLVKLKAAGVKEFKLNVMSTAPRIFKVLNPNENLEDMLRCYTDAVEVFGKGLVANSLYAGLGETDEEMEKSMRDVASRGVLSDIKIKKITAQNKDQIESALGHVEPLPLGKLIEYGLKLKEIESENGLDSHTYKTLCNACRGCNLVPFLDF